jgi:cyclic pyranopterin phosphate synthase
VIVENLIKALNSRRKDGFEAEAKRKNHTPVSESMSTIGGIVTGKSSMAQGL